MLKENGKNLSNIISGNTALINQKVSQLSEQSTKNNECLDKVIKDMKEFKTSFET